MAGLYSRINPDNYEVEYALAFAGTYFECSNRGVASAMEDILQLGGISEDMNLAISVGTDLVEKYGSQEITMVGHSKGGAEAVGASLATGRNAKTYNPAKVNATKLGKKGNPSIINFIVKGEILSQLDIGGEINGNRIEVNYIGEIRYLETSENLNFLQKHSIDTIIEILKDNKYK